MSEIYRDATGKAVALGIAGATNATAKFFRNGVQVGANATVQNTPSGYVALVPYAITAHDGPFIIQWTYKVEGNFYTKDYAHEVVSPVVLNPADPELEAAVRHFIEAYTNNYFGYIEGSVSVQGTGHHGLELPRRLISVTSVTVNGEEYAADGFVVTGDGWMLERAPGISLTIKDAPPDEYIPVYSNNLIVPPYSPYNTMFKDNVSFVIDGKWGYLSVPDDVMVAADLLYNDYACADAAYRNRFINSMRAGNWRFDLRDDAFAGTGNLTADRLLDKYRIDSMVII